MTPDSIGAADNDCKSDGFGAFAEPDPRRRLVKLRKSGPAGLQRGS